MKKKILTVQFRHETNSFCPKMADEEAYRNWRFLTGDEVFPNQRGVCTELGAYIDVLESREDIELIPSVALCASPCGLVSADVYDYVLREVSRVIRESGPFAGVLVDCHGAMVAEGHPDGEGDLFEMIRSLVGWDIPLMAAMDLHANVTEKMARCANVLVPYNTYPHIDIYETGSIVAKIMEKTLDGQCKPEMAYRRIPFLQPLIPSESPQLRPLYELADKLEKRSGVLSVKFTHGFFAADIEEMGMSVMIVTNDDKALAEKLADEMAQAIKTRIPELKQEYPTLDEALDMALLPFEGPVVLGDASDNPGGGGLGDTTHILRRILDRGITGAAIATIVDPVSVASCVKAGEGATVELELGGWSDPIYSGGPLHVNAYVKKITDGKYIFQGQMNHGVEANHGKTAVVEIAGNIVLITSVARQPLDLEIFRSHGIVPEKQRILVSKSAVHYKASYGTVARKMITLALPGYSSPIPKNYRYKHWKGNVC